MKMSRGDAAQLGQQLLLEFEPAVLTRKARFQVPNLSLEATFALQFGQWRSL